MEIQKADSNAEKAGDPGAKLPGATPSEEELKAKIRNREIQREDLSVRQRELLDRI